MGIFKEQKVLEQLSWNKILGWRKFLWESDFNLYTFVQHISVECFCHIK